MTDAVASVTKLAERAKKASRRLASAPTSLKNDALLRMGEALMASQSLILEANAEDMAAAREGGTSESLLDRLFLDESRLAGMRDALSDMAMLADPVGEVIHGWQLPNGLRINQVRVAIGVIGVIYEARPNVTVDATGLALKAGNAVILRGGSLARKSNLALTEVISRAALQAGLPEGAIGAIETVDREAAEALMHMDSLVDLLVPRGGPDLIRTVTTEATVPVLWAGAGNCHVYVHSDADFDMAEDIVINAKVQRPSVCNAAETLLIHSDVADSLLPRLVESLQDHDVEVRGCERTRKVAPGVPPASEEDYHTEFLDLIIAVKVVDSLDEAIDHINEYGTLHSDAIVTKDYQAAGRFENEVDAAAVYVNASTRFTDGAEFGMGAEIGISTQKLHARGPMGLTALTSTKYVIRGTGQVRP